MITLHTLRTLHSVTQQQMASRMAVQLQTVRNLENGNEFSYSTLVRYCDALGVSLQLSVALQNGTQEAVKMGRPYICDYETATKTIKLTPRKGKRLHIGHLYKEPNGYLFQTKTHQYRAKTTGGLLQQLRVDLGTKGYSTFSWNQAVSEADSLCPE